MAEPNYEIFKIFDSGFMTHYCALRVDSRRCRRRPLCQNSKSHIGKDSNSLLRAFDIHNTVTQGIAHAKTTQAEPDWQSVESQLEELMELKLCEDHQDHREIAVDSAMMMLRKNYGRRLTKVSGNGVRPQSTNSFHSKHGSSSAQGSWMEPQIPPASVPSQLSNHESSSNKGSWVTTQSSSDPVASAFEARPATPRSLPRTVVTEQSYQSCFSSTSSLRRAGAKPTTANPSIKEEEPRWPDLDTRSSTTPPSTPATAAPLAEGSVWSSISDKVQRHFATYPRPDSRRSIIDEILDALKALENRATQAESKRDKLQAHLQRLTVRLGKVEAEKETLEADNERLRHENLKLSSLLIDDDIS
ncbi:hypothetical protein Q7P37_000466 [Cladosporium fusiforme]